MLSDILVMFPSALDDNAMKTARTCLMDAAKSILVHQQDGQDRILLVKFDPHDTTPRQILKHVRKAGFDAKMAGA